MSDPDMQALADLWHATAKSARLEHTPGQLVPGQGIFITEFTPPGLSKVFEAYAMPVDLPDANKVRASLTFLKTLARFGELRDLYGYDGVSFIDQRELFNALDMGTYKDSWVIPPLAVMEAIQKNKDVGAFKDTFATESTKGVKMPSCYWTSTPMSSDDVLMGGIWISSGSKAYVRQDTSENSCRPIRLRAR